MFKRLAARGKTPPPPVASPMANSNAAESFDIEQNVNGGEGATPVSPTSTFVVTVYSLDDDQKAIDIEVQRDSDGQWLFDEVCEQLGGLQEKDYFGLRFLDREKQRQWVDPTRNIYRQLKHIHPCCVSFRVKHYPPNPLDDLKQEISKYFLYLQIKRDIVHSRLLCQGSEAYELAAYIAQADLGDYEDIEDPETYLADFKVLPNQSPKSETKIAEIHKTLTGILPNEAEAKCLALACKMETYGIDPYSVKDQKGNVLYLGLTHVGVVTFQGSRRAHIFKWSDITKFNYDGKLFIIHVTFREDNQFRRKKKHILGFKCESRAAALSLWRWAVDRYCFFTLKRSSEAKRSKSGGGLFRRSHTFRFSGRCQKEVLTTSASLMTLPQPVFTRTSSLRRDERTRSDTDEKFATYPRSRRNEKAEIVTMPRPSDTADDGAEDKRNSLLDKVSEMPTLQETPTPDKKTVEPSANDQGSPDVSARTHSLPTVVITEVAPCDRSESDYSLSEADDAELRLKEGAEEEVEEEEEEEDDDQKTVTEDVEVLEENDSGVEGLAADTETSSAADTLGDSRAEACILDEESEGTDDADPVVGASCLISINAVSSVAETDVINEEGKEKKVEEETAAAEQLIPTETEMLPEIETENETEIRQEVDAVTEIIVEQDRGLEMVSEGAQASSAESDPVLEAVRVEFSPQAELDKSGEEETREEKNVTRPEGEREEKDERAEKGEELATEKERVANEEKPEREIVKNGIEEENEQTATKEIGDESEISQEREIEAEVEKEKIEEKEQEEAEERKEEMEEKEQEEAEERKEEMEVKEQEEAEERKEEMEEQEEAEERKEEKEKKAEEKEEKEEKAEDSFASQGAVGLGGVRSEFCAEAAKAWRDDAVASEDAVVADVATAAEASPPVCASESAPVESDGGIVETIIVPSLSAPAASAPPAERGVDVGDGDIIRPQQQYQQYQQPELPCKQAPPAQPQHEDSASSSPDAYLDSNGKLDTGACQSPLAAPVPPASKGRRLRRCVTGLALLLFFSGATLVLLFELGPSWAPTRSLLDGAVLDDWRQQWYLPLRNRILPGPPQ